MTITIKSTKHYSHVFATFSHSAHKEDAQCYSHDWHRNLSMRNRQFDGLRVNYARAGAKAGANACAMLAFAFDMKFALISSTAVLRYDRG